MQSSSYAGSLTRPETTNSALRSTPSSVQPQPSSSRSQTMSSPSTPAAFVSSAPEEAFTSTPLHAQTKSPPIGPAVGGSLGGLALVALFAAFLLWRKRKRSIVLPVTQQPSAGPVASSHDDNSSVRPGKVANSMYASSEKVHEVETMEPVLPLHKTSTPLDDAFMFPPDTSLSNMFVSSPSSISHDHSGEGVDDSYTHDGHENASSCHGHAFDVEMGVVGGSIARPTPNEQGRAESDSYMVQDIPAGPRRPHYLSLLSISSLIPSIMPGQSSTTPQSTQSQSSRQSRSIRALPTPPPTPTPTPTPAASSLTSRPSVRRPLPVPQSPPPPSPRQLPQVHRTESPVPP